MKTDCAVAEKPCGTNFFLDNVRVVLPGEKVVSTSLRVEGGHVVAIGGGVAPVAGDRIVAGSGRLVTPGLVDLHVHGILEYSFDSGPDALFGAAGGFARFGTTTVFPTMVPRMRPGMLERLDAVAAVLDRVEGVKMPGLHLEGPFVALPGAGCDVVSGDTVLLEEILAACRRRVAVMSLSPDTPGVLPVIERLRELGVVPFVTHTRATVPQTRAAITAGARHATHFYDVFPQPPELDPGVRPAGVVETFLADPGVTVDVIADGCHVDPVVIQMAVRAKSCYGVALITDGNIGAGMPAGVYPTPWGYAVMVQPGNGARIADPGHQFHGSLAGSALTMNVAVANLMRWIDAPPESIWAMATTVPATVAGLRDQAGVIRIGQPADMVLWNEDLNPAITLLNGKLVFEQA